MAGRTDRAIARDLFQQHGIDDLPNHWQRLLQSYLRRLPLALSGHQGQILPGVAECLVRLRQRSDTVIGLLTGNAREGARLKLEHYRLFHHFAFGAFGDHHVERNAVAHDALDAAHRHTGNTLDLNRVWVIGDTPADIHCARAIGAKAVAVMTGWHSQEQLTAEGPDLLLKDLSDPEPWLSAWE